MRSSAMGPVPTKQPCYGPIPSCIPRPSPRLTLGPKRTPASRTFVRRLAVYIQGQWGAMSARPRRRVPLARAFGDALRDLREGGEWSQEELAHRSGLYRTHIGMLERGERRPSLVTVFRLAGTLGMRPSELLRTFEDRVVPP